jgi:hypothetical protein
MMERLFHARVSRASEGSSMSAAARMGAEDARVNQFVGDQMAR